jgi:uncharacterized protein YbaP (TraB family)
MQRNDDEKEVSVRSCKQSSVQPLRLLIRFLSLSSLIAVWSASGAQSNPPAPSDRSPELETVLVTGERPGPGMWKIKEDGNVLWILGTYGPLPAKVTWRSSEVEKVIANSREIYTGGGFETRFSGNRSEGKRLMDALQIGDGKALKDVVPLDLYVQFSALNQKYGHGGTSLHNFRPFYAGQQLTRQAIKGFNLTSDGGVDKTLRRLAKQHRVKIHSLTLRDAESAPQAIAELGALSREKDIPCFQSQLAKLESTINEAVIRANAWSVGDIATLREAFATTTENSADPCLDLLGLLNPLKEGSIEADRLEDDALRSALSKNQSTLAVIRIERLLRPQGLLERFRAAGYEIGEP